MEGADRLEAYAGLAEISPSEALDRLDEFLAEEAVAARPQLQARLARLGALAARGQNDLARSNTLLDRAGGYAALDDDRCVTTEIELTRSYNLFLGGRSEAALALVRSLDAGDDRRLEATIAFQHATILARTGDRAAARPLFATAARIADEVGFDHLLANVAKNLGMMAAEAGDHTEARRHLLEARRRFAELAIDFEVAAADRNLGVAAAYLGDLPTAFGHFEQAEAELARLGINDFEAAVGRCRALLAAGLFGEAVEVAGLAAGRCHQAGLEADAAELWLIEAEALTEVGRFEEAAVRAAAAAAALRSQDRPGRAASAELVLAGLRHRAGDRPSAAEIATIAGEIRAGGLQRDWLLARLLEAELTALAGDHEASDRIRSDLGPTIEAGPADLRLAAAACDAICLRQRGATGDAYAAATGGYRLLADEQAALSAADLRVGVRRHADRLASIGLEIAAGGDDPAPVFWWLESINLAAGTPPEVRPPADPKLRSELARLRALQPGDDGTRRRIEDTIRDLARGRSAGPGRAARTSSVEALTAALGDAVGLVFGAVEDRLVGCGLRDGQLTLATIGPVDDITRMSRALRADLRRRAVAADRANPARIERAYARLEELLLGPFPVEDRPIVLAAPPSLQSFAWAAMPSRRQRPTTTATSLTAWARNGSAASMAGPPGSTVLVAGPDLGQAEAEIDELARAAGGDQARSLTGAAATVASVLAAIDGAAVAHIAAHGTVRIDNPLFSSLRLADGELSVYELGDLGRAPRVVVLSACHVGLPADAPGRELLGMVSGFLNAGTSCVIASTLPVPDARSTVDLMTRLHRFLAAGMGPARAWAEVQRTCASEAELLDTASFTVFGRG